MTPETYAELLAENARLRQQIEDEGLKRLEQLQRYCDREKALKTALEKAGQERDRAVHFMEIVKNSFPHKKAADNQKDNTHAK